MIVVLAIDALEYELVERFNCAHLKQRYYGKTDISEFSEPRTMVLWSSFMTGENKEEEVLALGDAEMWSVHWDIEDTFFSWFDDPVVIDLPGFSYDLEQHARERELMKAFFEHEGEEREAIRREYNASALSHHRKIREEFERALSEEHDFVLGYFSAADVIGHLNFANRPLMRMIYRDLDEIASRVHHPMIVLSDHGMEQVGPFGDHSSYGFWSTDFKDLGRPRITEFRDVIREMMENERV